MPYCHRPTFAHHVTVEQLQHNRLILYVVVMVISTLLQICKPVN